MPDLLSCPHTRDPAGAVDSVVDSVPCWGEEVRRKSLVEIGTRGVTPGREDSLGERGLERLGGVKQ